MAGYVDEFVMPLPKSNIDRYREVATTAGEALADFRFDEFAQREIARLEELRIEAVEERLAAELANGGAEDLVGELHALVAEHPLRERLRGQLMVALYRRKSPFSSRSCGTGAAGRAPRPCEPALSGPLDDREYVKRGRA